MENKEILSLERYVVALCNFSCSLVIATYLSIKVSVGLNVPAVYRLRTSDWNLRRNMAVYEPDTRVR